MANITQSVNINTDNGTKFTHIDKGNLTGFGSVGGYWNNGKFYPSNVISVDPTTYAIISNPTNVTNNYNNVLTLNGSKSESSIEDDGHGVMTARYSITSSVQKDIPILSSHPKYPFTKCYKSSSQQNGSLWTTTGDYIGLASNKSESNTVLSGDFGLSIVDIRSHPDAFTGKKLCSADYGWDNDKGIFTGQKAIDKNIIGVRSYLSPELTLSGYFYSSSPSKVSVMLRQIGKSTNTLNFSGEDAAFYNLGGGSKNKSRCWLITGVSHEKFAHLYKIKFSLRYSADGWHDDIYKSA